jgi:nucleotide-binding universal stress UspA family protein
VDFGELMDVTLEQTALLAKKFDAEVVLIHAIEFIPYYAYEESISTVRRELETRMLGVKHDLEKRGVRVADPLLQVGAAWDAIVAAADEYDVNLILLGAGQKSLAERLLAGSTLEKVCRRARQPVWAMHPGDTRAEITKVLCAIDFSPAADQALQTAIHLCRATAAKLTVLHVDDGHRHYPNVPTLVLDLRKPEAGQSGEPAGEPQLGEYLAKFDLAGLDVTAAVRQGDVDEEILAADKEEKCDILVMGAMGHGSLLHRLMGNNTEKVLRKAASSVLTVKYQDIFKVVHDSIDLHRREVVDGLAALIKTVETEYTAGRSALASGDRDSARAAFRACVDHDPHFHPAWDALGDLELATGQPDQAAVCHKRAATERRYVWERLIEADIRAQHDIED